MSTLRSSQFTYFLSISMLACVFLLAACSTSGTTTTTSSSPTSRPVVKHPTVPVVTFGSAVDMTNKKAITILIVPSTTGNACQPSCFKPNNVKVKIGTVITWVNEGPIVHTVTATTGDIKLPQPAPWIFDSGATHPVKPQGAFTWTVTMAAYNFQADHIVIYYCQYHPLMEAELIIVA